MNSLLRSMGAVVVRFRSRTTDRPSQARPRQFRPLAEPMEARALLSQVALIPTGQGAADIVVNGQTENQPGEVVVHGLSPRGDTR